MIIKIDKKEIDLYKEACVLFELSFHEYTMESNDEMVVVEILIDGLEPSPTVCVMLGRQVQMNWDKKAHKETELFKSVKL